MSNPVNEDSVAVGTVDAAVVVSKETEFPINIYGFLECPVCLDFAVTPIYSCSNGHIVCGICQEKVKRCPTCKAENLSIMFLIDRILRCQGVEIPCRNSHHGCTRKIKPSEMKTHLTRSCDLRPIKCTQSPPAKPATCGGKSYLPGELFNHWKDIHKITKRDLEVCNNGINLVGVLRLSLAVPSKVYNQTMGQGTTALTGSTNIKQKAMTWPSSYFQMGDRIFFVHMHGKEETVHTWITLLGEESDARNFEYSAIVTSKLCISEKRQATITQVPVHSVQYYDFEKIHNSGHTAAINLSTLKMFQCSKPKESLNILEWNIRLEISKIEEPSRF